MPAIGYFLPRASIVMFAVPFDFTASADVVLTVACRLVGAGGGR